MDKIRQYFKDSIHELTNNVTWTPMNELQNYTFIVLMSLLLITIVIWAMDKISELIMIKGVYDNLV